GKEWQDKARPKALVDCIPDFFEHGTRTRSKYANDMRAWIKNFVDEQGEQKNVWTVKPEDVIKHARAFRDQGNLTQRTKVVLQFLAYATEKHFPRAEVKRWYEAEQIENESPTH